jgi:hypothetical protein
VSSWLYANTLAAVPGIAHFISFIHVTCNPVISWDQGIRSSISPGALVQMLPPKDQMGVPKKQSSEINRNAIIYSAV